MVYVVNTVCASPEGTCININTYIRVVENIIHKHARQLLLYIPAKVDYRVLLAIIARCGYNEYMCIITVNKNRGFSIFVVYYILCMYG